MILFSFDIDGTLEIGCGPIPMALLWKLKKQGHYLITGSDWPICLQQTNLPEELFDAFCTKSSLPTPHSFIEFGWDITESLHIGDTWDDVEAAKDAGFKYLTPSQFLLVFGVEEGRI